MSIETEVETTDDGRVHVKPAETGGLEQIWIAGQPVGKMLHALNRRVQKLERDNEDLREELDEYKKMVNDAHQQSSGSEYGSKKELAERIAHDEAVRVSTKGMSGGSIEYATVRNIADRQHGRTLHSATIYNAFDDLASEYEYLTVKRGEKGPNTKNQQLRCDRELVPDPVFERVQNRG